MRRHHLADRLRGQAVAGQLRPCGAAVARHEQAAAGPAALASPGVNLDLPHAGEQHPRVLRIHRDVRAAGVLVDEQRLRQVAPPSVVRNTPRSGCGP